MRFFSQKTKQKSKISIFKALELETWCFVSVQKTVSSLSTFVIHKTKLFSIYVQKKFLLRFATSILLLSTLAITTDLESSTDLLRKEITLNVLPSEVDGEFWHTPEAALVQDVNEDAVFQTFSKINSAYFDGSKPKLVETIEVASTSPSSDVSTTTSEVQLQTESDTIQIFEEIPSIQVDQSQSDTTEQNVEKSSTTTSQEVSLSQISIAFMQVLNPVTLPMLLVQQTLIEEVTTTNEQLQTNSENQDVSVPTETMLSENEIIETAELTEVVKELSVLNATATIETDDTHTLLNELEVDLQSYATSTVEIFETQTASTTDTQAVSDIATTTGMTATSTAFGMSEHAIEFDGFGLPQLESGQFIRNIQLRVSLAAQTNIPEGEWYPAINVEYSFGEDWNEAGSILLDDEVSNALNGGYFLFALPKIKKVNELENFKVRLSYVGDISHLENVYLDSLWIEVDTEVFDREVFAERIKPQALTHLKKSDMFTILSGDLDFTRHEVPRFSLRYESQRSTAVKVVRNIFGRKLAEVESLEVAHVGGGRVDVTPQIDVTSDGLITIQLADTDLANLPPGEYEVTLNVSEGSKIFSDSFNFQWGMLALNPSQSEYERGDDAYISFGAITRNGNTICDANLQLYIIDPDEYITEVDVTPSGKCSGNNITDTPDYTSFISNLDAVGEYTMYLERLDESGKVLSHTSDTFMVAGRHAVAVHRDGPTRIYPPAPYPMHITLVATSSWSGTLVEQVPKTFKIFDTDAQITEAGDMYELRWEVAMLGGSTRTFSYNFDAPDLSPYLYTLGPARLESKNSSQKSASTQVGSSTTQTNSVVMHADSYFEEHRKWQIASDATGNMILFWDDSNGIPANWTCVSCTGGDPFYQRLIVGSSTYNNTGGTTTHDHNASTSVFATTNATTENFSGTTIDTVTHTHTLTPTIQSISNLPAYRQLQVIQYTGGAGEPANIPTGAIGIFDDTVPSGWTQYSAQNGRYIYGENTIGTTGGSNTHAHTLTGTTGAGAGIVVGNRGPNQATGASAGHTHTISTSTETINKEPPYIEVILGQINSTSSAPNGLIAMWTDEVPQSWISVSGSGNVFSDKFLKATSTYGATGGSETHNHADKTTITTSVPSGTVSPAQSGTTGSGGSHTHTVTMTNFTTESHIPPYVTVVLGKRQGEIPVFTAESFRWYVHNNAQTPTDPWPSGATNLIEGEAITATSTPVDDDDIIRLRFNVSVQNATATVASTSIRLQYASTTGACSAISTWYNVGAATSSEVWRGYNAAPANGSTLSSTTLSTTTIGETYEENGYSAFIPTQIPPGDVAEWDFVLQHNGAYEGSTYCFRPVEFDGSAFFSYNTYARLYTNEAPEPPTLSKLFDNEKTPSTTPWFEFVTTDTEGEPISYQIQIDNDLDFTSTLFDHNSVSNSSLFQNIVTPSDKDPFTSGQTVRYIPNGSLTNGVTYWWRVRGRDPDGSNQWGYWSTPQSFTVDTGLTASAWFQTTEEQFDTNTLDGVEAVVSDQMQLISGSTTGTVIFDDADFDEGSLGTAWDSVAWNDTETTGDILYQVEYLDGTDTWTLIPNTDLAGNSSGFDTSPINLLNLDTDTYNQIRVTADFTDVSGSPSLQDITINWGYRVDTPTISKLFSNEKVGTTTPTFEFTTTDPQSDSLTYQISWSTDNTFTSSTTRTSDTHSGFINADAGGDLDPFNSGDTIQFTVQSSDALTNNTTYWWRVRAKDTTGDDAYSLWTQVRSFTVDTTVIVSTWFQTTEEQFATDILAGTTPLNTDVLAVATTAIEAMAVYGEGLESEPRYRIWNGTAWGSEGLLEDVGAPIVWASVKAGTTREEYVAVTLGTDSDINAQVYALGEWSDLTELTPSVTDYSAKGFDIAYETDSGRAMVAYCDGDSNPSYTLWDGSSWSTAAQITTATANNCTWIQLASDPNSNEIIILTRETTGGAYEAQVWSGTAWGTSTTLGNITESAHEGMTVEYEETSGEAVIISSDGNPARLRYNTWNGTAWGTASTQAIGDDFEWGYLAQDSGSDALALCYMDEDLDIGMLEWSGTAWNTFTELDVDGNAKTDPPFSCVYETTSGRDNYIMTVYSDTAATNYQFWNNSTWSGESQINSIGDTSTMQLVRTGIGRILGFFFDDVNDEILAADWNGTNWSSTTVIETNASVDSSPYGHPYEIGPRNSGREGTAVVTPPIYFTDGLGPYWDEMSWVDTTPGTSEILYSIQYYNGSSWNFVPNSEIPGNESGTTTSPIDLSGLNKNIYHTLRPYALLNCDLSDNCPTLSDWTVTWAEGITVSGTLMQYDEVSSTTSGTIAVAVNGTLQIGKTGTVSNGNWSISNVTAFPGDIVTVFVSGAADSAEAVGVTLYDGIGDITGFSLYEHHLAIGSNDATSTPITNIDIGLYDYTNSEDLFQNATGSKLTACVEVGCGDVEIKVKEGTYYRPEGLLYTHDFENNGYFLPQGNNITISGSYVDNATTSIATSTLIFSATSTAESIDVSVAVNNTLYNVTFGTTTGSATWSLISDIDINNNLVVDYGTLSRSGVNITVAGNLTTGASGFWSGLGTTTFGGSVAKTWTDNNATLQDIGNVVVDGTVKTVTLGQNALARSVTIGANDTLDASVSNYDITVLGNWINNGTFISRSGEVFMSATTTNQTITAGGDAFYDLTFNGFGGSWFFSEPTLSISNDLTFTNGTTTMPTGTTTLAGSFSSVGGTFAHNLGTILMTSSGAETIAASGTPFTNAFNNLVFNGSGSFTFLDTYATTSNDLRILQGSVAFPSAELTVGGSFTQSGGSFAHNSGTVSFTSASTETIDVNGSSFNSLSFDGSGSWTFLDTSVTADGSVWVNSGTVVFPSTNFSIGGSYGNNATVDSNNGTVTFNSTDAGETLNFGQSSLYNVLINGIGGGWTITNSATTTNNFTIGTSSDFTLSSGQTLSVGGQFANYVGGASTTWTGSILSLESGTYSINAKTQNGDSYDTLRVKAGAHISMWNSDASTYDIQSTGSLYSQDHAGTDGALYIFGDYTRTSGEEHWSYETDFDGSDISGAPRIADVRFADGATATLTGSLFSVIGSSTASTTIQNQGAGNYTITASSSTTTLNYYEFTDLGNTGVTFTGTGDVTSLSYGYVEPSVAAGTGFTISSTTIDANQGLQIYNVNFSTTTLIAATNVTQTDGTPVSYWWFRNSSGNIDGENFDNDTGDPGSIRWDDSSLVIIISGIVYQTDESTPMGTNVCDGATPYVTVVVENGSTYTGTCANGTGAYSIGGVVVVGDPTLTVYLDTNGGARGVTQTKTPTTDLTNFDIYQNHVTTRHEDVSPMSIDDMAAFDNSDDSDIGFSAATGTTDTLVVFAENELHIASSTTFNPQGVVTVNGNASSTPVDGTIHIDDNATFVGYSSTTITVAGSFIMDEGATFTPASTTVDMIATTSGKTITTVAGQEIDFTDLTFTGVGGTWNINGDIRVNQDILASTGTITGTADVTVENGSFSGNGIVSFGSGTTTIEKTNTLGGSTSWTFGNLVLGNGLVVGTTTPGSATTTVLETLTISTGHFLDAGNTVWNLAGTGNVFVEDGTFIEDTSTVRYSGTGNADVLSTTYYNLEIMAPASPSTYTATGLGIIVNNDLIVGGATTSTFDLNTNDPAFDVNNDVFINTFGVLDANSTGQFTVNGDWDNNGTFNGNGGLVTFDTSGTSNIYAGSSSFSNLTISSSTGTFVIGEHATTTGILTLEAATSFTLSSGQSLAVGTTFLNQVGGAATTWTNSTLFLYGGGNYEINASTTQDTYATLVVGGDTDIRMWNSDASTTTVASGSSLYSQDHANTNGDLYIYGDYPGNGSTDYWSYATDFDGTPLGSPRKVDVYVDASGSITYTNGGLAVIGVSTASTTIQNQGSGDITFRIGGAASTTMNYYELRNLDVNGLTFSGTPNVVDISYGDFEVTVNGGSAMTVGGTAITQNPALTFTNNYFATTTSITANNVTATGTSVSSWRFTNHNGNIDGENFDNDPDGDPGYIAWDDSAALITISGTVYEDEGTATSTICDGSTQNVHLRVAGLTSYTTSCNTSTGVYSISNIAYSPGDSFIVYIDGETQKAATVSEDPISNIGNMDLYENRVIVRHESTDPLSIADMAIWDSSDDADIPFTAVDSAPDTLTLPANRKLLVWTSKEFEPGGNVTLSGGGAGAAYDGTLELYSGATFTGVSGETHSIGGSLISGTGATFDDGGAAFTFTTTGSGRTIDTNESGFTDITFNGSGSWTVSDLAFTVDGDMTITAGSVTLPTATTTIGGSLTVTGGSFDANSGIMYFTSAGTENIQPGGSSFGGLTINGSGTFTVVGDNATATSDLLINSGTFTSATGTFAIGGDFINSATFTHGSGELIFTSAGLTEVHASGSDLFAVTFNGGGNYDFTDTSLALLDSLTINSGFVNMASGTMSIGGSLLNNGGSFNHSSGTILFNSSDTGETIDPNGSTFNAVTFGSASGGWTIVSDATSTANFAISAANTFIVNSGIRIEVLGLFTNYVGGSATTWTGSTLVINSGVGYTVNTNGTGGDIYNILEIGSSTALRAWDSSATTTMLDVNSSFYSQDNAGIAGDLYIYGNYVRTSATDYWSYATDFDGTSLSGSERQVSVYFDQNATATYSGSAALNIVGANGNETAITNQGSGTYAMQVLGGTLNAVYYSFANLNSTGLYFAGTPTISSLSEGDFTLAINGGSLITLSSTTLNYNAGLVSTNNSFATTTAITGTNVNLVGTTPTAWYFTGETGNLAGEDFDSDGGTACGSIRWDDSSCLLSQQSGYRFRSDNGGEGVPDSEWFDTDWTKRKRVTVTNSDAEGYIDATVEIGVTYDSDMQADFDDLRFTSNDGTTELNHFVETYTASTDAVVWVRIPLLATSTDTEIYMYYGNAGVADGSATTTFLMLDEFEDGNISEYSGDGAGEFVVNSSAQVFERTYSLKASDPDNGQTLNGGIYNSGYAVAQGQTLRWLQYIDTSTGSGDEVCTTFAAQSDSENYAVCLELYSDDRIVIAEDVLYNDTSGFIHATSAIPGNYSTGWYEVEVDWDTDNSIFVSLYQNDSLVATTSATDSTYTSGGVGYALWYYHGAWDIYSARTLLDTEPSISFGFEQVSGGADWYAALNTKASGVLVDDTIRVRFLIENTGVTVTDQNYEIEFAPKGSAPSCESVDYNDYVEIPNQSLCGTSDLCMQSSTNITNLASTTDLLGGDGTFTYGQIVEDASNNTGNITIDTGEYTELEYVITPTENVTDSSFCLRVTNEGTELDSYTRVAELELLFAPNITAASLNGGLDITLTGGATTTVYATGTVTDLNGYTDLANATATIYRSGVTDSCTTNTNNCYISSDPLCSFINCAGNTCDVSCTADVYYHADPTDIGAFAAETWRMTLAVEDLGGSVGTGTAPSIDLLTLRAISVDDAINYGTLSVNSDTGAFNATTTVENIGNEAIDITIEGTDLSDGGTSVIPVAEQIYATSTFTYSSCVFCSQLATTSTNIEVDLAKPTTTTPSVVDDVYWGINIPFGIAGAAHQGTNTFIPVAD